MGTIRMMTTCMVTGQAAAIAASVAIDARLAAMTEVPYRALRRGLLEMDCIL